MRSRRVWAVAGAHSYLVDVLALELGQELAQAVGVGLNSNGVKNLLDIIGRGLRVAALDEEEVSCEVLHFDGFFSVQCGPVSDLRDALARYCWREDSRILGQNGTDSLLVFVEEQESSIDLTAWRRLARRVLRRRVGGDESFGEMGLVSDQTGKSSK
jgi:hypothetical protein